MARSGKYATPLSERIKNSVVISPSECWEWTKHLTPTGYAQISIGSRPDNSRQNINAHRVSYRVFVGPIKDGMQIDHLCRNRACVNPGHLEQVTCKENIHRSNAVYKRLMAKTHCPQGHEYSEQNTYFSPTPHGGVSRSCKTCCKARTKQRYKMNHLQLSQALGAA
jgi:hypothetical protein